MIGRLISWVRALVSVPTAQALALRELEDARRALLEAQSGREYAESLCKYHDARIRRLSAYLQDFREKTA